MYANIFRLTLMVALVFALSAKSVTAVRYSLFWNGLNDIAIQNYFGTVINTVTF